MTTFIRADFRLDTLLSNDGDNIIYFHFKTPEILQLFDYESWEYPKSNVEAVSRVPSNWCMC